MNNIFLVGNIVRDNTERYTKDGKLILSNSIAVRRNYKNANDEYESDFFNFTAYGSTASFISKNIEKGNKIAISGRLRNNNYEKDGQTVYSNDIVVEEVQIMSKKATDNLATNKEEDNFLE